MRLTKRQAYEKLTKPLAVMSLSLTPGSQAMRHWRLIVCAILVGGLVWMMRTGPAAKPLYPLQEPALPMTVLGSAYDPASCGTIAGRAVWDGPVPQVDPISIPDSPYMPKSFPPKPHPTAPVVAPGGGVADALVYLKRVDFNRSRPWPHEPVLIEAADMDIRLRQGSTVGRLGIVRRGMAVAMVSREAAMHSVRASGAAFFTQMLTDPEVPVARTFDEAGLVEITSGSGLFWTRCFLWVGDHPYSAATDANGAFQLDHVPNGEYEVVCWKANWHVAKMERDPEWMAHIRMELKPPVEKRRTIRVKAGRVSDCEFHISAADFE